jgi:hypothetical protein
VRDTRGSDIDGACGQLAASDQGPRPEAHPERARGEEDGVLLPSVALPVPEAAEPGRLPGGRRGVEEPVPLGADPDEA